LKTKINTTEKGNQLELRALDIIQKLIEDNQISHLKENLRIKRKPESKYYSNIRKGYIEFDLSIEFWPPGADKMALLYLVECKNYENRVSVNKIETFHSQLVQLQLFNIKGIFITNSPLQKGGYNIADSAGIMVIQAEANEDYKIILHKTSRKDDFRQIPFVLETQNLNLLDIGVKLVEKIIDKKIFEAFIQNIPDTHVSYQIDRLSKDDIETIANFELDKINPSILSKAHTLNPQTLKKFLADQYDIEIESFCEPEHMFGFCDIQERTIGLNSNIIGTNRELFILAHEMGHFILHKKLKIGQISYNNFEDSRFNFQTQKHDLKNPKNWIEWQANSFASSLVLPSKVLIAKAFWLQQRLGVAKGKIYLDDDYENIKIYRELIKKLAYLLNTSQTSVIYKLNELDMINNQSRLKSIGQILKEYREGLLV